MRIQILCVSKRPSTWVAAACDDYLKRLKGQLDVSIVEISPGAKHDKRDVLLAKEAQKMKRVVPPKAFTIALDERGKLWSTADFVQQLAHWRESHQDLVCLIGGAEGLDPALRQQANVQWSLSTLTLPHQMVRVMLVEQLYRAWSSLNQHPYHRAGA